jgi:hypothetical protein
LPKKINTAYISIYIEIVDPIIKQL